MKLVVTIFSLVCLTACSQKKEVAESTNVCTPPVGAYTQGLRHRGNSQIGNVRLPKPGHYEFRAGNMSVALQGGNDVRPDLLAAVIRVPSAAPLEWKLPGSDKWEKVPLEDLTPPQDAEQFAAEGKPLNSRPINLDVGIK